MTSKLNNKISAAYGENEEFFGGEMQPFVAHLHTELKKVEESLPAVPTTLPKLNWWKRFTALF